MLCVAACCHVLQREPALHQWHLYLPHHCVCCSVLQCVVVCCSVLQFVTVCYSVLQCVAVCCSVLQCVAVCCSVLPCAAVCCSVSLRCINGTYTPHTTACVAVSSSSVCNTHRHTCAKLIHAYICNTYTHHYHTYTHATLNGQSQCDSNRP